MTTFCSPAATAKLGKSLVSPAFCSPVARCARTSAFTARKAPRLASKSWLGQRSALVPTVLGAVSLLSTRSVAAGSICAMASTSEQATFAAGCFWGVEHYFNKHFKGAILKSAVGYTGGAAENPKYQAVCSGATGHAEAVRFEFDPSKAKFADLVEYFYRIHDPTTANRQGNDVGTQYRSAVFYHDDEQKRIAEEVTAEVQNKHYAGKKIATEIVPEQTWWNAEDYHQQYLVNNPGGYCNHFERW